MKGSSENDLFLRTIIYYQKTVSGDTLKQLGLILLLFLFVLACGEESNVSEWEEDLEGVKNKYVPDERVAIFEYELNRVGDTTMIEGSTTLPEVKHAVDSLVENTPDKLIRNKLEVLPSDSLSETWGLVHLSVANIRSSSAHSSELVTQAIMGTPLLLFSQDGDWYRVQTPDGYIGWMDDEGFTPKTDGQISGWKSSDRRVYKEFSGKILAEPMQGSHMVRDVIMGDIVVSKGKTKNEFLNIELPDGLRGWVPNDELIRLDSLHLQEEASMGEGVLSVAKSMMGVPYLWGGTSPKAMDCSGYTKMAYWMNGLILPRDASQQVKKGISVELTDSLEQLEPGDLIYFGRITDSGKSRITHVVIHMGDRRIIHASGRVKTESLNPADSLFNPYRFNTKMAVRRILNGGSQNDVQRIKDHTWYY